MVCKILRRHAQRGCSSQQKGSAINFPFSITTSVHSRRLWGWFCEGLLFVELFRCLKNWILMIRLKNIASRSLSGYATHSRSTGCCEGNLNAYLAYAVRWPADQQTSLLTFSEFLAISQTPESWNALLAWTGNLSGETRFRMNAADGASSD